VIILCKVTNRPTETKHVKKGDNEEAKFGYFELRSGTRREGSR